MAALERSHHVCEEDHREAEQVFWSAGSHGQHQLPVMGMSQLSTIPFLSH
jgi:hypothetical protein